MAFMYRERIGVGVISYLYNNSLIAIADEMLLYEIPLFAILSNYSFSMLALMAILLWFAIFTTAAAGLLGIVTRLRSFLRSEEHTSELQSRGQLVCRLLLEN